MARFGRPIRMDVRIEKKTFKNTPERVVGCSWSGSMAENNWKAIEKYRRQFYLDIHSNEFRKNVLLGLLSTCKDIVEKVEVAKEIAKRTGRDEKSILSQMGDKKSRPVEILEKFFIVLTLPKPEEAKGRKSSEFLILTDIGKWIKNKCRDGDEFCLYTLDESLLDIIASVALINIDEKFEYDSKQLAIYLILLRYTNIGILGKPVISVKIETPKDPDWKRPGCRIYIKVEKEGLVISNEKGLEDDLRALVLSWIGNILSIYPRYGSDDIMTIKNKLKFEFIPRPEENFIKVEAKVRPHGILYGDIRG